MEKSVKTRIPFLISIINIIAVIISILADSEISRSLDEIIALYIKLSFIPAIVSLYMTKIQKHNQFTKINNILNIGFGASI